MDRASKARVLTASDVMLAHDRACANLKKWGTIIKHDTDENCVGDLLAGGTMGISFFAQELMGLLAESEGEE